MSETKPDDGWRFVVFDPATRLEIWKNEKTGQYQDRLPVKRGGVGPLEARELEERAEK